MLNKYFKSYWLIVLLILSASLQAAINLPQIPLNLASSNTPLIMLTMERDHKLYYEAYNDSSDVNGDGKLDLHYDPAILYYGYFDSYKCYDYVSSGISSGSSSGGFVPARTTTDKTCSGNWSGDFLNYLTTSRMDALRRVLYGGKRSTDSTSETVLERAFIPQDAHSWGKEYTSTTIDGYDISKFTPLQQPTTGKRHLFANTTLLCPTPTGYPADPGCNSNVGAPLLRMLDNSNYRVWEWVSIESPVAGVQCATSGNVRANCATTPGWAIVPAASFRNLTQKTYAKSTSVFSPSNKAAFDTQEATYATGGNLKGTATVANIDRSGDSLATEAGLTDFFINIFQGDIFAPVAGQYSFGVDGDDTVDLFIDGSFVMGWYGIHASCGSIPDNCVSLSGYPASVTLNLSAGWHSIKFRHEESNGGFAYKFWCKLPPGALSTMTDFVVRVKACVPGLLEANECRGYPSNNPSAYKPGGILQQFGENDRMAFGLMTGSYSKNLSGGVLRKNISSFTDEIDKNTGMLNAGTNGIIKTLDALKIIGFGNSTSYWYMLDCVPIGIGPLTEGRCRNWGNPIAEMMYESLRYFAGKSAPTSDFTYASTPDDSTLGLPQPTWQDPYKSKATGGGGFSSCAKPSLMVISDINPNFDTNQLPGRYEYTAPSALTPATFTGDLTNFNAIALSDTIWAGEFGAGVTKSFFVGQSQNNYDGAPSPKTVSSFASMRGLSPEEPSRQGGYYAGSVALYGKTTDLNPAQGDQKTDTFSVALASPFPKITFPINGKTVTLIPFAKSIGGCGYTAVKGNFQATNTIADLYIETLVNTDSTNIDSTINAGRPKAIFRINYEDAEFGNDYDMDAVAKYELTALANNTLDVRVKADFATSSCIQHMGYVIDGTTADGIYLEIRDSDTAAGSDVDYYLDTPNLAGTPLPLDTTRNFTPGTNSTSTFVDHDPLWYAAKWGGFIDSNKNNQLDSTNGIKEWDNRDGEDGIPDSYFLVTSATKLKQQLDRTFTELLTRDSSSSTAASNSGQLRTDSRIYLAIYKPTDWSGQLLAFQVNAQNIGIQEWDAGAKINMQDYSTERVIITKGATGDGVGFSYANLTGDNATVGSQQYYLSRSVSNVLDNCGPERVAYLRGDASHEAASGAFTCASGSVIPSFRKRAISKLGDIVNSNPWYVGEPTLGLSDVDFPGYNAFRRSKFNRKPVVYVGANDGMLHGFDASLDFSTAAAGVPTPNAGKEVLGFIPSQVFQNLNRLPEQNYSQNHRFFVDGSPMVGDANLGSITTPDWRTVLVGGLGAGGKGYYALDVSDPTSFNETNAANIFLWEFDEADMGYAFNTPPIDSITSQALQIVKMDNGKWAAVLGNGYNSANGKAVLYIVYIKEGVDGVWSATDYVKLVAGYQVGVDNGLSTPVPFDSNEDGMVDVIYAGDLQGNLWKFAVGDTNPGNWKVDFSTSTCGNASPSTCIPLFKATDSSATPKAEPIFWPPVVTLHPVIGQLVLFGTGKFIETPDATNLDRQTFYGIWDKNDGITKITSKTTDLLKQEFSTSTSCPSPLTADSACTLTTTAGRSLRISTSRPINWRSTTTGASADCVPTATCKPSHLGWYIDYPVDGERTTGIATLQSGLLFFNTYLPVTTSCGEGIGFLAALDYANGGMFASPIFDSNTNGMVNASDFRATAIQIDPAQGGSKILDTSDPTSIQGVAVSIASDGTKSGKPGTDPVALPKSLTRGRLNWQEIIPN